jgi:outer membrane protein W
MQIAFLLLVTSALVAPPAASLSSSSPAAAQQRAAAAPTATISQAHRLGFGGAVAVSNQGFSGSTRYWFSRHVGVSMAAGWYRPRQYGYSGYSSSVSSPSTVMASPSLMVTFNSTDPNREVSLRPYLGVGASYMHATSRPGQVAGAPAGTYSNTTPVGLGGTELFFRDHPSLTLSVDGIYYRLPSQFVSRANVNGLNFQVSAHFYLK